MDEKYNEALDLYQAGEYEKAIEAMAQSKAVAPEVYQQFVQQCRNLMGQTVPTQAANPDNTSTIVKVRKKHMLIGGVLALLGILGLWPSIAGMQWVPLYSWLSYVLNNLISIAFITSLPLGVVLCLVWVLPKRATNLSTIYLRWQKCGIIILGIALLDYLVSNVCYSPDELLYYWYGSGYYRVSVSLILLITKLSFAGFILVVMAFKNRLK